MHDLNNFPRHTVSEFIIVWTSFGFLIYNLGLTQVSEPCPVRGVETGHCIEKIGLVVSLFVDNNDHCHSLQEMSADSREIHAYNKDQDISRFN